MGSWRAEERARTHANRYEVLGRAVLADVQHVYGGECGMIVGKAAHGLEMRDVGNGAAFFVFALLVTVTLRAGS